MQSISREKKNLLASTVLIVTVVSGFIVFRSFAAIEASVHVSTSNIGGVPITGTPSCSGTTNSTTLYYDCGGTGVISTVLEAPEIITIKNVPWRLTGWRGCDAKVSQLSILDVYYSNSCSITAPIGQTKFVEALYLIGTSSQQAGTAGKYVIGMNASIGRASDGSPEVAYYQSNTRSDKGFSAMCTDSYMPEQCDLKFVRCSDVDCTNQEISTIDSADDSGLYNAIVIPPDNLPVISYYAGGDAPICDVTGSECSQRCGRDGSSEDSRYCNLKIVKCGNATCSKNNKITTLDSFGMTGLQSSISLAGDGLPVGVYTGGIFGTSSLKLFKCSVLDCTTSTVTELLKNDPSSNFLFPQITIKSNGMPIIVFSVKRGLDHELHVLNCGDQSCSPSKRTDKSLLIYGLSDFWKPHLSFGLTQADLPIISYASNNHFGNPPQEHHLLLCGDVSCSTFSDKLLLPAGYDLNPESMTGVIGSRAVSVISQGEHNLLAITCNLPDCSEKTSTLIYSFAPGVTISGSALISMQGSFGFGGGTKLVVVALTEKSGYSVVLVSCGKPDCSGAPAREITLATVGPL